MGILAVRRAKKSDMAKLSKATGGKIVTSIEESSESDLGYLHFHQTSCRGPHPF